MGIKACLTSVESKPSSQAIAWFLSRCKTMIYSGEASVYSGMVIYLMVMVMLKHIWVFISTRLKKIKPIWRTVHVFCLFFILLLDVSVYLSVHLSFSVCLSPSIHLSICPCVCSPFHIFTCLTSYINGRLYYIKEEYINHNVEKHLALWKRKN